MQLILVSGLIASTVIDAKFYIIPLRIPHAVTVAALIGLPVAAVWLPAVEEVAPDGGVEGFGAAIGGVSGWHWRCYCCT